MRNVEAIFGGVLALVVLGVAIFAVLRTGFTGMDGGPAYIGAHNIQSICEAELLEDNDLAQSIEDEIVSQQERLKKLKREVDLVDRFFSDEQTTEQLLTVFLIQKLDEIEGALVQYRELDRVRESSNESRERIWDIVIGLLALALGYFLNPGVRNLGKEK